MSLTQAARTALEKLGHVFFRTRNGLFPVAVLVLIFAFPPRLVGSAESDPWVDAAGLALAAAGQLLRLAVIGFAYIRRGGKDRRIYADDLVTEGFFAHCRNPMYVGNLAIYWGLLLVHGNPWTLLIGVPFYGIAYLSITLAEEAYLRAQFGERYEAYCRDVPRFGFRLAGLRQTLAGASFDWRKVIRKEYGTVFATLTAVLVLIDWEAYTLSPATWTELAWPLAYVWAALLAAYLVARYLKKTGRLGRDAAAQGRA